MFERGRLGGQHATDALEPGGLGGGPGYAIAGYQDMNVITNGQRRGECLEGSVLEGDAVVGGEQKSGHVL